MVTVRWGPTDTCDTGCSFNGNNNCGSAAFGRGMRTIERHSSYFRSWTHNSYNCFNNIRPIIIIIIIITATFRNGKNSVKIFLDPDCRDTPPLRKKMNIHSRAGKT